MSNSSNPGSDPTESLSGSPYGSSGSTQPFQLAEAWKPLTVAIPAVLLPLMAFMRFVPSLVQNGPSMIWMASAFGPFLVGLLVVLWWLLMSRARWFERIIGLVGLIGSIAFAIGVADPSVRTVLPVVMTIPMAIAGFGLGAALFGRTLSMKRTWIAIALAFLASMFTALVRTDGVWGNFAFGLDWRWNTTSEEKALAYQKQAKKAVELDAADREAQMDKVRNPEWPGFRGADGASRQIGLKFGDDWGTKPPKELWRIPVGPAWSSFAVAGDRLYTQEQRGENEAVVCYDANTGKEHWAHLTPSRFFESLGGLGPRATPTLAEGGLFALGAEGWLMRLDPLTGESVWQVDLKGASGRKDPPMWGFSCSPCVENGWVIVHAGGENDKGVLAFQVADGKLAWSSPAGEMSYSSVQKITLLDRPYLCLLSNLGAHFWDPATGKLVYDYEFKHQGYRALQAQVIDGNKLLIPAGMGTGTQLVEFTSKTPPGTDEGTEKTVQLEGRALWTSKDMKPDFNDILVHDGNVYGFDNAIFACISLDDGTRKWKGGRYEKGQAFLLEDSGLILVVSEKGELVLLRATPNKHEELGKIAALSDKTWNHPVVVGNRLFLRNAEEAVCYLLPSTDAE